MIRKACIDDIDCILSIINYAKEKLKQDGSNQWQEPNYPSRETLERDINNNVSIVFEEDNNILGVMCLTHIKDNWYNEINGNWLSSFDLPFLTIHRLATAKDSKGIGIKLMMYAQDECIRQNYASIKVDTMDINFRMQSLLLKHGFEKRGTIILPRDILNPYRDAFEWINHKYIKNK